MPLSTKTVLTIDQAIQRGMDTWDLYVDGFGLGADIIYPNMATQEAPIQSVFGVAIGPMSRFDRCTMLWDPMVIVNSGTALSRPDFLHRLMPRSPLLYTQFGQRVFNTPGGVAVAPISAVRIAADALAAGANGTIDASTVRVPTEFVSAPGVLTNTDLDINPARTQLHIVFYLNPPTFGPGAQRYPYWENQAIIVGGTAGVEGLVAVIPVAGRDRVAIRAVATGGTTYTVRVGGLPAGVGPNQEVTLATSGAVALATPVNIYVDKPTYDYLVIWKTVTAVGSPIGTGTIHWIAVDSI